MINKFNKSTKNAIHHSFPHTKKKELTETFFFPPAKSIPIEDYRHFLSQKKKNEFHHVWLHVHYSWLFVKAWTTQKKQIAMKSPQKSSSLSASRRKRFKLIPSRFQVDSSEVQWKSVSKSFCYMPSAFDCSWRLATGHCFVTMCSCGRVAMCIVKRVFKEVTS